MAPLPALCEPFIAFTVPLSVKVTEWLAGYNDPIKLLLGTHIQKTNRVVIKRKHVVGQSAIITPEHAPAQSVAVQEEVTEVVFFLASRPGSQERKKMV